MAAFTKVNDFVHHLGLGVHNLSTATLKLALSNTAPGSESPDPTSDGNGNLSNVTQIAYTNVNGGQPTLASVTWAVAAGVATLDAADEVIEASGGSIPQFRYVYVYDDTAAGDELIGVYDNGSAIDLADGESVTFTISATGICTLT